MDFFSQPLIFFAKILFVQNKKILHLLYYEINMYKLISYKNYIQIHKQNNKL